MRVEGAQDTCKPITRTMVTLTKKPETALQNFFEH